jgi:hypothetical protein
MPLVAAVHIIVAAEDVCRVVRNDHRHGTGIRSGAAAVPQFSTAMMMRGRIIAAAAVHHHAAHGTEGRC